MKTNKKLKKILLLSAFAILALLLLACEIWKCELFNCDEDAYLTATRLIGAAIAFILIIYSSLGNVLKIRLRGLGRAVLFTLPCWLIAINNFPFIALITGEAQLSASAGKIALYAFQCLCVGLFEELAFRGCIFLFALDGHRKSTFDLFLAIVISSAIFGAVHFVNVFAGASIISVILQIGYSFLIGGMCSVVLMKTGCIWHCVLIHAVYNFCGGVVPTLGGGEIWNTPTVVLTVIVSLAVAAYVVVSLLRIDPKSLGYMFGEKSAKAETITSYSDTIIEK